MKKFATVLFIAFIFVAAYWNLRPLLVDDVVEEGFPPVTEEVEKEGADDVMEKEVMEKEEDPLEEHNMTQEEIDAMSEDDKMAMEKKIVEELMEKPAVVMAEAMPEPVMEKMEKAPEPEVQEETAPTPPPAPAEPTLTASGSFQGADDFHKGSGSAKVFQQPDGSHFLRFENFSVTNGPDLRVYLVGAANPSKAQVSGGLELAKLKGNKGSQNYILPAGVNPADYGSVVIYCKPFKVVFATANLN